MIFLCYSDKHLSLRRHQVAFAFDSTAEYECNAGYKKADAADDLVVTW